MLPTLRSRAFEGAAIKWCMNRRHGRPLQSQPAKGLWWALQLIVTLPVVAASTNDADIALDRIIHGWTNYSTAFDATQTAGSQSDYATVASFYTPGCDICLLEYRVVVVWGGRMGQQVNFGNFDFQVLVWSNLASFTNSPRHGDMATVTFPAPTGGSTSMPDAITLGGRPAYELAFCLTNIPIRLAHAQTYLIGFAARNYVSGYDDLFVPTSGHAGQSDVQAGDLLIQGWIEIVNSSGSTVYSGQLATALSVQSLAEPPRLNLRLISGCLELTWPSGAGCFTLESSSQFLPLAWHPVTPVPAIEDGLYKLTISPQAELQWFRLKK